LLGFVEISGAAELDIFERYSLSSRAPRFTGGFASSDTTIWHATLASLIRQKEAISSALRVFAANANISVLIDARRGMMFFIP
jgi:hypothetical protein